MPSSSLRPHIVFVLVDDWGYDLWPRSGGDLGALLPHIERTFVNDGLTLGRHYAFSWCAPSRRSFLSGRLPHNVLQDDQGCRGIPLEMTIFPETLKRAGYSTHFIGKWHCGYATPEATPTGRGFDSAIGFFGKAHDHFEHCMYHGASTGACNRAPDDTTGGPPLLDFFVDDRYGEGGSHPAVKTRQYSTHLYTRQAVAVVEAHGRARARVLARARAGAAKGTAGGEPPVAGGGAPAAGEGSPAAGGDSPLFLLLSYSAPHYPLMAPQRHMNHSVATRGPSHEACGWALPPQLTCSPATRRVYEAMASAVDEGIGEITEALRARHMWHRSLLVFTSDNGGSLPRQGSNGPLRGGKFSHFDGGVRTVASMAGGYLPPPLRGATSATLVHLSDWAATFAHLARTSAFDARANASMPPVPPVDSVDVWPQLLQELDASGGASHPPQPRTLLLSTRVVVEADGSGGLWKLLKGRQCECMGSACPCADCNATGCLYDLAADEGERREVSAEQPVVLRRLRLKLKRAVMSSAKYDDPNPFNAECDVPEPGYFLNYAFLNGNVLQPWLRLHE